MARPGLTNHRKFRRLARLVGGPIVARGALELLWDQCYEAGDDYLGTAEDIESAVGWAGEAGSLADALDRCGQPEGHGFIEPADAPGTWRVHDLWRYSTKEERKRDYKRRSRRLGLGDPTRWVAVRVRILNRDLWRCRYCSRPADTVDHVVPRSKGGGHDDANLVAACRRCNSRKQDRTAAEAGLALIGGRTNG